MKTRGHEFGSAPVFLAAISTILGEIIFFRICYAVAFTPALIVYLWKSLLPLAVISGISMIISIIIVALYSAVIPIILKVFSQDLAQSSAIILTTVTDILGFLI